MRPKCFEGSCRPLFANASIFSWRLVKRVGPKDKADEHIRSHLLDQMALRRPDRAAQGKASALAAFIKFSSSTYLAFGCIANVNSGAPNTLRASASLNMQRRLRAPRQLSYWATTPGVQSKRSR
jgi:hypothetical protein